MSAARNVARAIDAFRRGWPVAIDDLVCLAVETADAPGVAALDAGGPADLLIPARRAETLHLTNRIEAASAGPVRLGRKDCTDLALALAIADPALDLATPLKGPFDVRAPLEGEGAAAALRLARFAGLLPAVFAAASGSAEAATSAAAIHAFAHTRDVRIVSRARLPTAIAEKAEIVAFRIEGDTGEAVALLVGEPRGEPPLVRIHSECLTGDALGSLKCDCGTQLRDALAAIAASGWGILLYLRQEGRGIGLVNKLRAYALQDQGFDTVDANHRLGFEDDERDFGVGAHMLIALSQRVIRLLSNNPRKAAGLAEHGIEVAAVVPLQVPPGTHNRDYLAAKRDRSGHQL